jgi:hypothetical protein
VILTGLAVRLRFLDAGLCARGADFVRAVLLFLGALRVAVAVGAAVFLVTGAASAKVLAFFCAGCLLESFLPVAAAALVEGLRPLLVCVLDAAEWDAVLLFKLSFT